MASTKAGLFSHTLDSMAKLSGGSRIAQEGPVVFNAVPELYCENHRPSPH